MSEVRGWFSKCIPKKKLQNQNSEKFDKQVPTGKGGQQKPVRKNIASKPPGSSILVNRNEPSRPSTSNVAFDLNHLDNEKDTPAVDVTDHEQVAFAVNEIDAAEAVTVQNESPKNKHNKKKKTDALLVQKLVDAGVASTTSDDINVNVILQFLGRSELTRSEIQILIDFLLNKQQDTANVTNCDWSDDLIQKLRRQLEVKDRQLSEEQMASIALHTKVRELRAEFNNERLHFHQRFSATNERCNALTEELARVQQDSQASKDEYEKLFAIQKFDVEQMIAEKDGKIAEFRNKLDKLSSNQCELKHVQEASGQASQEQYAKQMDELNAIIKSYQSLIAEKDGQIAEFKNILDEVSSNQREKELFDEVTVDKAKNNVVSFSDQSD